MGGNLPLCLQCRPPGAEPHHEDAERNPFHAYLTLPATADVSKVRVRIVTRGDENDGETTDIDPSTLIYDLQGRRVAHPAKGIYIVNGRKVVIK